MAYAFSRISRLLLLLALGSTGCGDHQAQRSWLRDASSGSVFPADTRLAQNYVLFAYKNIGQIIHNCLEPRFSPCSLTDRETHLLKAIEAKLPEEYQTEDQIEFRSEAASPGFFLLDGDVRIAKTYSAVGDKIFFNQDFLYADGLGGVGREPIDIGSVIAILVHELGHHHDADPPYSHAELDLLGSKVRENNARKMVVVQDGSRTPLYSPALIALNNNPRTFESSRLWMVGTSALKDITDAFLEAGTCPWNFPQHEQYYTNYPVGFSFHYAGIVAASVDRMAVQAYGDMICHSRQRDGSICMECLRVIAPQPPRYNLEISLAPDASGAGADFSDLSLRVTHPPSY